MANIKGGFLVQRVAIYARVSSDDQSCERQLAELEAYASRNEFQVVGSFKETGSGVKNSRLKRKEVLELARRQKIDLVLVSELSRWGRSTLDLRTTVESLAERKVALRALNGPEFDISTAHGKLMLNLLSSISEFERDLLRERIKSGVAHARSNGTKSGKPIGRPTFEHTEKIKHLIASGTSIRKIAAKFGISKTTVMKIKSGTSGKSRVVQ